MFFNFLAIILWKSICILFLWITICILLHERNYLDLDTICFLS